MEAGKSAEPLIYGFCRHYSGTRGLNKNSLNCRHSALHNLITRVHKLKLIIFRPETKCSSLDEVMIVVISFSLFSLCVLSVQFSVANGILKHEHDGEICDCVSRLILCTPSFPLHAPVTERDRKKSDNLLNPRPAV